MKPYYNIVHKTFKAAILRKLRQGLCLEGVTYVSDNTEYKMSDIDVAENQHK